MGECAMSHTQVAKDIYAVMQLMTDEHEDYPLEVEMANFSSVDKTQQEKPYLKVEVNFMQAEQANLGVNPLVKQWGQIWVTAIERSGRGWLESSVLLEFVRPYLELRKLGIITCLSVQSLKPREVNEEWHCPIIVNFYYHRQT
jgi:hypothetical protein